MTKRFSLFLGIILAFAAQAAMMERPGGIKIGQRMTLRPYVSVEATYDSNVDQQQDGEYDIAWYVNPHLDLTYQGDNFTGGLSAFYGYRYYTRNVRQEDEQNYGESLNLAWTTSSKGEKGWTVLLTEQFQKMNADDDMRNTNGRGMWRDRYQFDIQGAIQRRFNEKIHADVNASYYYLDYDNSDQQFMNLYGWQRYTVGAEAGYVLSPWTDFIVAGSYQGYMQDNSEDLSGLAEQYGTRDRYSRNSQGWSLQGGIQSHLTEKITYRLLAGWSRFEYSDGLFTDDGFTYSASANWKINETWTTMARAESYYMPSEREFGSANRVDMVSWGIGHTMIRGKLNATFDIAYRRETRVCNDISTYDYDENILSARLGLNYWINRFLAVYLRGEYQGSIFGGDTGGMERDYNRFRASLGFTLTY